MAKRMHVKPKKKATAWIQIRITPDQKALLSAAANAAGLGLAPWLRQLALKAVKDQL